MNRMKKYKSGMDVQGGIDSAARAEAGDVMEGQRISPKMPGVATSLRPKLRPKSVEQKAKMRKVKPKMRPKSTAEPKSPLRPSADGEGLTTKSLLQPRADGRGLTTKRDKMKANPTSKDYPIGTSAQDFRAGGKVRGYGKARGGKACKMR